MQMTITKLAKIAQSYFYFKSTDETFYSHNGYRLPSWYAKEGDLMNIVSSMVGISIAGIAASMMRWCCSD